MNAAGIGRAADIVSNRDRRPKELKAAGHEVIGYYCSHVPREILTAAEIVPYRIMGNINEPINKADVYLETIMCPFVRSTFDLALKEQFVFLDGIIVPHTCDSIERIFPIWRYYLQPSFSYLLNVPHMTYDSSFDFFEEEVQLFVKKLGESFDRDITEEKLLASIRLHNENRRMLKKLYEYRKHNPPLVSGSEASRVVLAGLTIPPNEYQQLLKEVLTEVESRLPGPDEKKARVMIYGAQVDHTSFIELVEEIGGDVVIDDVCTGTRSFWNEVPEEGNLFRGIADTYLDKIRCPRTHRPGQSAQDRFAYLEDNAQQFGVNSVILYVTRFCDTHEFDAPEIRDFLVSKGYQVLFIEEDYSAAAIGQMKTRVQAFLERVI